MRKNIKKNESGKRKTENDFIHHSRYLHPLIVAAPGSKIFRLRFVLFSGIDIQTVFREKQNLKPFFLSPSGLENFFET